MNLYNVKNIKDLPQLEQILPGNFIVVENFTGTNKLDFEDFVVGPRNTSFANQVFNDILQLSANVIMLSSYDTVLLTTVNTVSTQHINDKEVVDSQIQGIDERVSDLEEIDFVSSVFTLSAEYRNLLQQVEIINQALSDLSNIPAAVQDNAESISSLDSRVTALENP